MDISEKTDKAIESYVRRTLVRNCAVSISGTFPDYSTERLHRHPFHQVLMIHDGMTVLEDADAAQALFGIQCAIIPAGIAHRSVSIGGEIAYQSLYIRSNMLKCSTSSITIFPISSLGYECFKKLAGTQTVSQGKSIEMDIFKLLLKIILEDSSHAQSALRLPIPKSTLGSKVAAYIKKNYSGTIHLEDFRNISPLSTRQIARLFKNDCGITLFEYLRGYRLMTASLELSTGKKILETAYDCGYSSVSSFFADFRRYYGTTPSKFLKTSLRQ
jgi:AraC-like DNA-binding protein